MRFKSFFQSQLFPANIALVSVFFIFALMSLQFAIMPFVALEKQTLAYQQQSQTYLASINVQPSKQYLAKQEVTSDEGQVTLADKTVNSNNPQPTTHNLQPTAYNPQPAVLGASTPIFSISFIDALRASIGDLFFWWPWGKVFNNEPTIYYGDPCDDCIDNCNRHNDGIDACLSDSNRINCVLRYEECRANNEERQKCLDYNNAINSCKTDCNNNFPVGGARNACLVDCGSTKTCPSAVTCSPCSDCGSKKSCDSECAGACDCVPNCSCEDDTCAGDTCPNGCGGTCDGRKECGITCECDFNEERTICDGVDYQNSCGNWCRGRKTCTSDSACSLNCGSHGSCKFQNSAQICECKDGYTGDRCSIAPPNPQPPTSTCDANCQCIRIGAIGIDGTGNCVWPQPNLDSNKTYITIGGKITNSMNNSGISNVSVTIYNANGESKIVTTDTSGNYSISNYFYKGLDYAVRPSVVSGYSKATATNTNAWNNCENNGAGGYQPTHPTYECQPSEGSKLGCGNQCNFIFDPISLVASNIRAEIAVRNLNLKAGDSDYKSGETLEISATITDSDKNATEGQIWVKKAGDISIPWCKDPSPSNDGWCLLKSITPDNTQTQNNITANFRPSMSMSNTETSAKFTAIARAKDTAWCSGNPEEIARGVKSCGASSAVEFTVDKSEGTTTKPDLIFSGLEVRPPAPTVNDTVQITIKVKNNGEAATIDAAVIELYVDPTVVGPLEIDRSQAVQGFTTVALAPGIDEQKFNYTYQPNTLSVGKHQVYVVVDANGDIDESDEDNYYGPGEFTVVDDTQIGQPACSSDLDCDDNNDCTTDTCSAPGERITSRCEHVNNPQNGTWTYSAWSACSGACDGGTGTQIRTAICSASCGGTCGTKGATSQSCTNNTACSNVCTPSQTRCQGTQVQTCKSDGSGWRAPTNCSDGSTCSGNSCITVTTLKTGDIDGDNDMDIVDAVLEIELIFGNATVGDDRVHVQARSDVNGDGSTNINDVLEIINIAFNSGS